MEQYLHKRSMAEFLWDGLRAYFSIWIISLYLSIIYFDLWQRVRDSKMANRANCLTIRKLCIISLKINHLGWLSTVVLLFYSFSYSLYFRKKWYHWYQAGWQIVDRMQLVLPVCRCYPSFSIWLWIESQRSYGCCTTFAHSNQKGDRKHMVMDTIPFGGLENANGTIRWPPKRHGNERFGIQGGTGILH